MANGDAVIEKLCRSSLQLMVDGTRADFEAMVHPDAWNRESRAEPPNCRHKGPDAFYASAQWLRTAFTELRWEIHDIVAMGDLGVVHTTMSGRHMGVFVVYDDHARPVQAFPPTGRRFAVTQTHWCRIADGKLIEHWANRDDLGQAGQLGWLPPSPVYVLRMRAALRRLKRRDERLVT